MFLKPTTQQACTRGQTGQPGQNAAVQNMPHVTSKGSVSRLHRVSVHDPASVRDRQDVWIGVRTIQNARRHSLQLQNGPSGQLSKPVRAVTHPIPKYQRRFLQESARENHVLEIPGMRNSAISQFVNRDTEVGVTGASAQWKVENVFF